MAPGELLTSKLERWWRRPRWLNTIKHLKMELDTITLVAAQQAAVAKELRQI